MSNIKFVNELFTEYTELNRLFKLLGELGFEKFFVSMTKNFGVIRKGSDANNTQLKIYQSSSGKIGIKAGSAFGDNGKLIYVDSDVDDLTTITNNSTTYRIFITHSETQIEEGTLQLLSNGSIIGTNTKFTELFVAGKSIEIINSASGNNGIYEVLSVTDDENITTDATFTAESSVQFKFVGLTTPDAGVSDADRKIYYYDSYTVSVESNSNEPNDSKFLLASVSNTGGTLTITDLRSQNWFGFSELYDAFTYADSFRVGGASGQLVQLVSDLPEEIQNIRITDISGIELKFVDDAQEIPYLSKTISNAVVDQGSLVYSNRLRIELKWGWDYITGAGGSNIFTVSNSGLTFTDNQIQNLFIWIPNISKNLKIVSNTGNVLSVQEKDGTDIDLSGIATTTNAPAIINFDAEEYEVTAIPYKGDTFYKDDNTSKKQYFSESPTIMKAYVDLFIGAKYIIKVRGINFGKKGAYGEMEPGSFTKYSTTQNYGNIVVGKPNVFLVYHPQISSSGLSVSATPTNFGFDIQVNGWTDAKMLEFCWTTENTGANFNNPNHNHLISTRKIVSVTTNISAEYNIKVRPLINGQQVADEVAAVVISGSAGLLPEERIAATVDVFHRTYSGTLTYNSTAEGIITSIAAIKTPSGGSTSLDELPANVINEVITIDSKDYIILNKVGSASFEIQPLNNNAYPSDGAGKTFTIGVSERARREYISKLSPDWDLTRTTFDCNALHNGNVIISIYQENRKAYADTMIINDNDAQFEIDNDVQVLSTYGERNLIVSLYDDNDNYNENGISGRLVIYGKPIKMNTKLEVAS